MYACMYVNNRCNNKLNAVAALGIGRFPPKGVDPRFFPFIKFDADDSPWKVLSEQIRIRISANKKIQSGDVFFFCYLYILVIY